MSSRLASLPPAAHHLAALVEVTPDTLVVGLRLAAKPIRRLTTRRLAPEELSWSEAADHALVAGLEELESLMSAAQAKFGEKVGDWLRTPEPTLMGLTPRDIIISGEGDALWGILTPAPSS